MRSRFDKSLSQIDSELMEMGSLLKEGLVLIKDVINNPEIETVNKIIEIEKNVDQLEFSIQSKSLKLLAFQQPVARDLRAVTTGINMITDMERIADQCVDIAEIAFKMSPLPENIGEFNDLIKVFEMIEQCKIMLLNSLNAYKTQDLDLSFEIIESDDIVDNLFVQTRDELIVSLDKDIENGERAIDIIMIAKYLERIADHCVNIAEWIIFKETGEHKNTQIF